MTGDAIPRILRGIETDLAGSDPRLAGLFAMFTSLTRGEELPAAEKLKAGPVRMLAWLRRASGLGRLFYTVAYLALAHLVAHGRAGGGGSPPIGHCVTRACPQSHDVRGAAGQRRWHSAGQQVAEHKGVRPPAAASPVNEIKLRERITALEAGIASLRQERDDYRSAAETFARAVHVLTVENDALRKELNNRRGSGVTALPTRS